MMRKVVRGLIRFFANLVADIEVGDISSIPPSGAFVMATNHIGIIDIAMFHYVLDRYDMFIPVADKWEEKAWIRWLAKYLNFIFVDRYNGDLKTMRKMMNMMEEGKSLVIAPEGTRSRNGGLIEGQPGVSYLAARSGFPVIPVAITGTEDKVLWENIKHFRKSKVTLRTGPAFTVAPLDKNNREAALQQTTDEIMCRIAAILPERYRGIYANHPKLKELLAAH